MFTYFLIAFPILVLAGLFFVLIQKRRQKKQHITPYIEALHLLLEDKKEMALEKLKRTVKEDTENIMAYIKLGDILREEGYAERAVKIHRNLLVRNHLTDAQIDMILSHLIQDFIAARQLNKAVETAERLSGRTKKSVKNQQLLLSLYENQGNWDKAYFCRQSILKWEKNKNQDILALYKVMSGQACIKKGNEREGRIRFREAMKLDKKCIPAYLYLGDSYRRVDRLVDAVRIWKDFTQKNTERSYLVFDKLREVLFELGRYSDMEEIYQQIMKKKPKNPETALQLAELYKKQGNTQNALAFCEKVLESHPDSVKGKYLYITLLKQQGNDKEALDKAIELLHQENNQKYTCSNCGKESAELLWRCTICGEWKTYLI